MSSKTGQELSNRPGRTPVLFAVVPAPASAHGDCEGHLCHLSVKLLQLDAGESDRVQIVPGAEEGPWQEGMVFIVYLAFFNETRDATVGLVYNGTEVVKAWHPQHEQRHYLSTRLPHGGDHYELEVTNHGPGQTQLVYFFDQNCNCVEKPIPLDEGFVVFHFDLQGGKRYLLETPVAPGWKVHGWLTTLTDDRAAWPEDFELHREELVTGEPGGESWIRFRANPGSDARYYAFFQAVEGSPDLPDPSQYVTITFQITQSTPSGSPGFGLLAGGLVMAACALRLGRTRA